MKNEERRMKNEEAQYVPPQFSIPKSSFFILHSFFRGTRILLLLLLAAPLRAEDPPNYPPPVQVKAAFLKLLDRPKVNSDVKMASSEKTSLEGFILEHFTFASEKKADGSYERVPVLILKPATARGKL